MNRIGLKQLIESYLSAGIKVYPDFVPEGANLPAVVYDHTNNSRQQRDLKARPAGKTDTWRLTILADDRAGCDSILNQLELLDSQNNANFQLVEILSVTDDPVNELDNQYRISIDLQTYDR